MPNIYEILKKNPNDLSAEERVEIKFVWKQIKSKFTSETNEANLELIRQNYEYRARRRF